MAQNKTKRVEYLVIDLEGRATKVAAERFDYQSNQELFYLKDGSGSNVVAAMPRQSIQMVVRADSVRGIK